VVQQSPKEQMRMVVRLCGLLDYGWNKLSSIIKEG
jgi:hypothetical protein